MSATLATGLSIEEENSRPGSRDWWPARHAPTGAIEAYTTQVSGRAGDRLELCVSARPAARYRLSVYRLGFYSGDGGRLVYEQPPAAAISRLPDSPDPNTGRCRAGWPVTDSILVGEDWTPGQYTVNLTLETGPHAGTAALVPFVVRRPAGRPAALLVQTGVNTWQAYNHWGGKSLYASNSTDNAPAVKVSFDRPVLSWDDANLNARAPFHYDLPLIRFLEREGYDLEYQTNVDTHREPWTLLGARALMVGGHDEYWTQEIRQGFERACEAGAHLLFMGANLCYWQIRYEDQERTLVEYRSKRNDPIRDASLKTVLWRDLEPPQPESHLIGVRYRDGITSPDALLDYEVAEGAAEDSWGKAFADGAPLRELVGYEWDALDPEFEPPGLVRLLHCEDERSNADCIRWRAPSGAHVFAAGSLALVHGLDGWARPGLADSRVQSLIRTALGEMLS